MHTRLVKTKRKIHLVYTSTLVGLAECLPLGILQVGAVELNAGLIKSFPPAFACFMVHVLLSFDSLEHCWADFC